MENSSENKRSNTEALLRMQRIQIILTACILIVILAVGIFLALQFNSISRVVDEIDQRVQSFDMDALNNAVDSFTDLVNRGFFDNDVVWDQQEIHIPTSQRLRLNLNSGIMAISRHGKCLKIGMQRSFMVFQQMVVHLKNIWSISHTMKETVA